LSHAKLNPWLGKTDDEVEGLLIEYNQKVDREKNKIDLYSVSDWGRSFYHPDTLNELLAWVEIGHRERDSFLLACLMGIAHHQRPGFLSFPSSHLTPYLREKKFPRSEFPDLYEYRAVFPRLLKKILRARGNMSVAVSSLYREVRCCDAASLVLDERVDAIVTSPPYMGQLDYARDNRLRLHLLGINDHENLNRKISPTANEFVRQMDEWLAAWRTLLKPNGKLAVLVGDTTNTTKRRLDNLVVELITEKWQDYKLVSNFESSIPDARRSRKNCKGSLSESLLVFQLKT
jgi:hypothetical protein